MQFYQHSGRCGFWGVPLSAAAGIAAGGVLGFVYSYVINWIPLVYISFLATAAFGFCVGAAVATAARFGKMRNMAITCLVAGLAGVIAVYFAWVFDPMARIDVIDGPVWSLESLWEYVQFGYLQGFWALGRNGNPVTGPILAAVWIAEAAIIVGVAWWAVSALLGNQPFCEETAQWTKTEKGVSRLSLVDDAEAEAKLKHLLEGELSDLSQFYRAVGEEVAYLQLDLATCADCPTCNFLTIRLIQHVPNRKGEVTKQEQKLLVNLQIDPEELDLVRGAGSDRPPPVPTGEESSEATETA